MEEPARKFDEERLPGNAESAPPGKTDLRVIEGGGTSGPTHTGKLSSAPEPAAEETAAVAASTKPDLKVIEGGGNENQVGKGYTGQGKQTGLRQHFTPERKRVAMVFGGAAALLSILSIFIFLILLPAKIYDIVQNVQRIFFSSSEAAVKNMEQQELSVYSRNVIWPALGRKLPGKTCGTSTLSVIDSSCYVVQDKGLFGNLFTSWRQANLEQKLAQDGIVFQKSQGKFLLNMDGIGTANISDVVTGDKTILDSDGWKSFPSTKAFKEAVANRIDEKMQGATYYKKTMYRYKVARLLEQKYGIKMCIIACDARRDFKDYVDKKKAAAIIRAQRVLQPRDQMLGFILDCLLNYSPGNRTSLCDLHRNADTTDQDKITPDGCAGECNLNGEALNKAEKEIDSEVDKLALKYGITSAADYAAAETFLKAYESGGFTKYLLTRTIYNALIGLGSNDGNEVTGGTGRDSAKLAGQIADDYIVAIKALTVAAILVKSANTLAELMPALGYASQAQTMVSTFATYRTYTDECKTGNCDPTMFGSFISSLGQGNQDPDGIHPNDIGGTAGAEQTPLYSLLLGDKTGVGASNYLCGNAALGNTPAPPTSGELVCPEERIDATAKINLKPVVNQPGWSELNAAAGAFLTAKNYMTNIFSTLFCGLTGGLCNWLASGVQSLLGSLTNFLGQYVGKLIKHIASFLLNYLLPPPPSGTWPSGGRSFDMIAAGADVSGNDFAHHSLGGVVLNSAQVSAIRNSQNIAEQQRYNSQSFFAKMFDEDYSGSLISQLALAAPANPVGAVKTVVANLFANPFGKILQSFALAFGLHTKVAHAAGTTDCSSELMTTDPFCVTQYGYPQDDPIFNQDPEAYWNQNCVAPAASNGGVNPEMQAWNQEAANYANAQPDGTIKPDQNLPGAYTGLDSSGTNPCLLILTSVGAGGGAFSSSVLSADDTCDNTNSCDNSSITNPPPASSSAGASTTTTTPPFLCGPQNVGLPGCQSSNPYMP